MRPSALLAVVILVACAGPTPRHETVADNAIPARVRTSIDLIPRRAILGAPDHANVLISPDGKNIAWVGLDEGVPNIFIAPSEDPSAARALTHLTGRGVRWFVFARDDQRILYRVDNDGDANLHLVVLDIATGVSRDATPAPGSRSSVIAVSDQHRSSTLISTFKAGAEFADVFELDLARGTTKLVYENRDRLAEFTANDDWRTLIAERRDDKGGKEIVALDVAKRKVRTLLSVTAADAATTQPMSVSADGKMLYMATSQERDTSALVELDIATAKRRLVADDPRVDVGEIVFHPTTHAPRLSYFEYETVTSVLTDTAIAGDLAVIKAERDGKSLWSASRDDSVWLVSIADNNSPTRYYIYDRQERELRFLFTGRETLANAKLPARRTVVVPARDSEQLLTYVTLPTSADDDDLPWVRQPMPAVVYVHSGPWFRDTHGFDASAAWLADRGYVVLQVNHRGSAGFGKRFRGLGGGGVMEDDVVDVVQWATKRRIIDPERVAVYGGRDEALIGTPTLFRCGVSAGEAGPTTYSLFSNDGHGLVRAKNQAALAEVESFLGTSLGGFVEPAGL